MDFMDYLKCGLFPNPINPTYFHFSHVLDMARKDPSGFSDRRLEDKFKGRINYDLGMRSSPGQHRVEVVNKRQQVTVPTIKDKTLVGPGLS
ncbi:hypothetical protein RRG08_014373 [Elysia crispata]|uniref:Uncharacterized protein n=1 Tax=Elysia crispata TaxID=231223 RepID=A0AAE1D1Q8_9GAST|nr:hypothetical protein RRG08_014373 [Elysia crispata]